MGYDRKDDSSTTATKLTAVNLVSGRSAKLDAINFDKDSLPDSIKQNLKRQAGV